MKKIFIDPGHGGFEKLSYGEYNPGATYGNRFEARDVYKLSADVAARLGGISDLQVKVSRMSYTDPKLTARCDEANKWGADYFISIHRNAFKPNGASGVEAWIYSKATKGGDAWTKAARFTDALSNVMGIGNRGVHLGAPNYTDYAVNNYTHMTSCLLEVGFVDSDKDNAAFDAHYSEMVEVIAENLCKAVGVKYLEKGDVDGDGDVDVSDARAVLRAAVGLEELDDAAEKRADVDGDGKVTVADAREILRAATGLNS